MVAQKKYLAVATISLAVFIFFLFAVEANFGALYSIDNYVSANINSFHTPVLTTVMVFFSFIGDYWFVAFISVLISLRFLWSKRYADVIIVMVATGSAGFLTGLSKNLVGRFRPEYFPSVLHTYAFPSGHSVIATVFAFLLCYFFARSIQDKIFRGIFVTVNIVMAVMVGFSRIYLNVHWVSDVVAGFSLGLFLVSFTIWIINWIVKGKILKH